MKTNLEELLFELDEIWSTFTIECNGIKHLIPVNDYSLDMDRINEWISLQTPYYQNISKILIENNFIKHISYKVFLKKCIETIDKLERLILEKIKILNSNQKVLILLNLIPVGFYKSENWVFSLMYSGGLLLDNRKRSFRNILKKIYSLYSNKIEIKILYSNKYSETILEILNDPIDYIILDCKFDDCSYSGSQLCNGIINISNIIFNQLRQHQKYTIKNPDINDDNGIFYFDFKSTISNISNYNSYFNNNLLESYSNNNYIYILDRIKNFSKYNSKYNTNKLYIGKSNYILYKNTYKNIISNVSLKDRIELVNDIYKDIFIYNKDINFYNYDNIDKSLMDLYKQIKGINYYICLCIPYITNTANEELDKLLNDNPFYNLVRLNVETPINIESKLKKYNIEKNDNEETIDDICLGDISNIFYGNKIQHKIICDKYSLSYEYTTFSSNENANFCNYLDKITNYKNQINKRCFIYFDHKMATFNSSFPMTLLLGSIWFPNTRIPFFNRTPFFYGPLIKNPALINYSNIEFKNLLKTFGDINNTNYYFFDKFIIPPYKLDNLEKVNKYLNDFNNCDNIDNNLCNCLPKCKKRLDKCIKKTNWDLVREGWRFW